MSVSDILPLDDISTLITALASLLAAIAALIRALRKR